MPKSRKRKRKGGPTAPTIRCAMCNRKVVNGACPGRYCPGRAWLVAR